MMTTQSGRDFTTVTGYLSWDHDRLDGILDGVRLLVDGDRITEARESYRGFAAGLDRHIHVEEEFLFPLFEARSGIVDGPTAVMRQEHREIRKALGLMEDALAKEDAQAFREGMTFLLQVLPDHNVKEERMLYPTTDKLLGEEERNGLVRRLRGE